MTIFTFVIESPLAGKVNMIIRVADHKYLQRLLKLLFFLIQFQCELFFFSTKIVDYRSCYWVSLNNFAMIKLYKEL